MKINNKNHILDSNLINKELNIEYIIEKIKNCSNLKDSKKIKCINSLIKVNKSIKVIKKIEDISVDFAIIDNNNKIYLIEYNENQHYIDSNTRKTKIYDNLNNEIKIPRFLQRLLRDIWRWKYLDNYCIVWKNWFELNKNKANNFLISGKCEFSLENKFKISDLI